ncbi:hypothetical protein QUF80_21540 [Desulfococcaceae bacterium HSG8]|nr:hypothetical protein [Desulfococcaceae bacterium HSG8]
MGSYHSTKSFNLSADLEVGKKFSGSLGSNGVSDFQKRIYQVRFVVPPSGGVIMPPEGGTTNFDLVCFLLEIT